MVRVEVPLANGHGQQTNVIQGAVIPVRRRDDGNKSFSGSSEITAGSQRWPEPHAAVLHHIPVPLCIHHRESVHEHGYPVLRDDSGGSGIRPYETCPSVTFDSLESGLDPLLILNILEVAWMTVMFAPMPSRIFRVRE